MKRIPGMNSKSLAHGVAVILLGAASLVSVASASEDVVKTAGNISYVSGGIGDESLDQLGSVAREFNLKLVFALKTGDYVSDVMVSVADAKGKTLLETTSEGPWLMLKLPAGNYQVAATLAGKTIKRQIAVGKGKLRTVDFRWAAE